jgi:hypothetical protein
MNLRIHNTDATPIAADTAETVKAELQSVNGRAKAFTIQTFEAVQAIAARAEEMLEERLVPPSYRAGCILTYRPAGPWASAYDHRARSTQITLKRGRDAWFLTNVERVLLRPGDNERERLAITGAARDAAVRRLLNRAVVVASAA